MTWRTCSDTNVRNSVKSTMYPSSKTLAWLAAGSAVYFGVLGLEAGIVILLTVICSLFGSGLVVLYYGKKKSDATYGEVSFPCLPTSRGNPRILQMMRLEEPTIPKLDRRLTGASVIDEQLQEMIDYIFRDYIETWYCRITDDRRFTVELRRIMNSSVSSFASRVKMIDWTPFLTENIVDELASHVKLYRRANQKLRKDHVTKGSVSTAGDSFLLDSSDEDEIETIFFEYEMEMEEKLCREAICSDKEKEKVYLQTVVETLLYFLLPEGVFDNRLCRYLVREVLVNKVILPTIDGMAEPDYVNQYVIWLCYDSTLTSESFLATLRMSRNVRELQCVLVKVENEIVRVRSKDSGGVDDVEVKQTLSSLSYLKKFCETQIVKLSQSSREDEVDFLEVPISVPISVPKTTLSFHYALNNEICLHHFNEYLIGIEKDIYLNMLIDAECYLKLSVPHLQAEETSDSDENATRMVEEMYEKYFAGDVSLDIDESCIRNIKSAIEQRKISGNEFDDLQDALMEKLEKLYIAFRSHPLYEGMVRELDLESSSVSSFSDDCADGSQPVGGDERAAETKLSATIIQTGIARDRSDKPYAIYSLKVSEVVLAGGIREWETARRYSDFYDLHLIICDKYPSLRALSFPGKKAFNNMTTEFLEKRATSLTDYLQHVLTSAEYSRLPDLRRLMLNFLQLGEWERPKDGGPNKVEVFMKKMSSTMKSVPDNLIGDVFDGFGKGFGKSFSKIKTKLSLAPSLSKNQLDRHKVSASLDTEDDDNIPMRIMMLLMDEVFDLRKKNQWFRRRIVAILRQIIKAAYGDKINKRIVDHVEMMTSANQVAEYIRQVKDRLWPGGVAAQSHAPRDKESKLRAAVVCKAKMIGSVPDELRHLIGSETTRSGILRLFNTFQHKKLNKRLIYAVLENFLKTLFPRESLEKVIRQIHAKSQRGRADSSLSQCS